MILAVDVGNTNIKIGFTKDNTILQAFNIATDSGKTSDEYLIFIDIFAKKAKINLEELEGIIICSVVPSLDPIFETLSKRLLGKNPIFVEPGIKTGLIINAENPKEVGSDIVSIAAGAIYFYGTPSITISFGTATVFIPISRNNTLLGVSIAPGLISSTEALIKKASKLPRFNIKDPNTFIGKNTITSLQAGFYYGFQGLTRNIIEGMKKEMKEKKIKIIATGGLSEFAVNTIKEIDAIDPYLSLKGLSVIYDKNVKNR